MASARASLITCSFRGDLEMCGMLCRSIDRFVPAGIEHLLYVPSQDLPLFAAFATPQRQILPQEALLPRWFWQVPLPDPQWREWLGLPRRNLYLTPCSLPVRGWIAQQIMKISAALNAPTEIVGHIDSDLVFVRPLAFEHFVRRGDVRFFAQPSPFGFATQRPWYAAAAKLLGAPGSENANNLYIDQFVIWRRSVVRDMAARIEATTGRDWRVALARTRQFAEYVLYGMFVEHLKGASAAGLYAQTRSLCHTRWTGRFASVEDEDAFVRSLQTDQVACVIQSTIPMTLDERARVFDRVTRRAADTDARADQRRA